MNELLSEVAARLRQVIDRQVYLQDFSDIWSLLSGELAKLNGNEQIEYLFHYLCVRFTLSGDPLRSCFDAMMFHSFKIKYTQDPDDVILRDVMCVYLVAHYKGDRRDCRKSNWPDAHLLGSIFEVEDKIDEERRIANLDWPSFPRG